MAHLIDKDALLAEIERRQDRITKGIFSIPLTGRERADATFEYEILGKIKDFLDTLEVKEVDLEKEYEYYMNKEISEKEWIREDYLDLAKHFFELGLQVSNKVQKGEKKYEV